MRPFLLVLFLFPAYVQPVATVFLPFLLSFAASPHVSTAVVSSLLLPIVVVAFVQSSPFEDYTTPSFGHLEAQKEACLFFSAVL